MRYIDADNLPRHGNRGGLVYWRDIEAQPPADVVERSSYESMEHTVAKLNEALSNSVEVVRCKDCRWYEINELKSDGTEDRRYKPSMCVLHSRSFKENYYCADGERADT